MKFICAILDAFRNKRTRPRAVIWTGSVLIALTLIIPLMVLATSSYWFCSTFCHYPQRDAVTSYNRSTHSNVACITCHKQPGADPLSFTLFKVNALFSELPPAIMRTADVPLNPRSDLALWPSHISSDMCTQCHDMGNQNRPNRTSDGIIMSHVAHTDLNITCTACHNRAGHDEGGDWEPVLTPTDNNNPKHDDFMKMTACYRCHRFEQDDGQKVNTPYPVAHFPAATGECSTCHSAGFDLVPDNHKVPNFVSEVHGSWALEVEQAVDAIIANNENIPVYRDLSHYDDKESKAIDGIPSVRAINYCYTCHTKNFCNDCHGGIEMPHASNYRKAHVQEVAEKADACSLCHADSKAAGEGTCTYCHHSDPNIPGWQFDTSQSWTYQQHGPASTQVGTTECFTCHKPSECAKCHVSLNR